MFLCETKLTSVHMENVGKKLKFENYFWVSRGGKNGGLAMLWNSETRVDITSFNKHCIDIEVELKVGSR